MAIRIKNIELFTGVFPVIKDAEVIVDGGIITYAGACPQGCSQGYPKGQGAEINTDTVIDGGGGLLMPGLNNSHCHAAMTLLRGYGGNMNLHDWLNKKIFPAEDKLTDAAVYYGTLLAIAEMLRFGVTSFYDMYFFMDMAAAAVKDSGMRATLTRGIAGGIERTDSIMQADELYDKWNMAGDGLIKIGYAIHSEYATSPEMAELINKKRLERNAPLTLHMSETREETQGCLQRRAKTPTQYFYDMGALDENVTCAHCVWVTQQDMQLLARSGATVSHNPISNLKLASGVMPLAEMLSSGVKIALGTDGVSSNNTHNMWEEIRLAAILHGGITYNPAAVFPQSILDMATINGAAAMRHKSVGRLLPGWRADMILLDTSGAHHCPRLSDMDNIVYSTQGCDVVMTMVNGAVLYDRGKYLSIDIDKVKHEAEKYSEIITRR